MRFRATIIASLALVIGCVSSPRRTASIWAAISADQALYYRFTDEIHISFSAVNDTDVPVLYSDFRSGAELIVNGHKLADSAFIFRGGMIPRERYLQPGKVYGFVIQLTRYFAEPGTYRVVWKGKSFTTSPIVFRVVDLTPGVITRTEASHIARKVSREKSDLPEDAPSAIKETPEAFVFVYPRIDGKGPHGEDYYTKVTVDKKTGKVTEFLKPR